MAQSLTRFVRAAPEAHHSTRSCQRPFAGTEVKLSRVHTADHTSVSLRGDVALLRPRPVPADRWCVRTKSSRSPTDHKHAAAPFPARKRSAHRAMVSGRSDTVVPRMPPPHYSSGAYPAPALVVLMTLGPCPGAERGPAFVESNSASISSSAEVRTSLLNVSPCI